MGDMADWFLDHVLDPPDGMDWDEYEDLGYIGPPHGPQSKRCKYCGEAPLFWYEKWPGNWRLRRSDGTPHDCLGDRRKRLLADIERRRDSL